MNRAPQQLRGLEWATINFGIVHNDEAKTVVGVIEWIGKDVRKWGAFDAYKTHISNHASVAEAVAAVWEKAS